MWKHIFLLQPIIQYSFNFFFFLLSSVILFHSKEYWLAKVDDSVCYDSSVSTCMMYISFCHPVPPSIGAGCYGSSVCQIGTFSSGKQQELSMGAYANFTRFHESEFICWYNYVCWVLVKWSVYTTGEWVRFSVVWTLQMILIPGSVIHYVCISRRSLLLQFWGSTSLHTRTLRPIT